MGRPCAACSSEHSAEINRKLKSGATNADVSRWLTEKGAPITVHAIGRHARDHLGRDVSRGRRPVSADFLESVRDAAAEGLASGELAVTLKDGIAAQKALDAREAKEKDRDWQLKLLMALTGRVPTPFLPDPSVEAIEGQYRPLLNPGAE